MSDREPYTNDRTGLMEKLVANGHLIPSGERGIYGRGSVCETVYSRVDALLTLFTLEDKPEILRFPPLVPRLLLDKVGYPWNFPHLLGAIACIEADETQRVTDLQDTPSLIFEHTSLALLPAACFPAYPAIARRGVLSSGGAMLDLGATCVYRNEPSDDPARLQVFHQRELVAMGSEKKVLKWRERWMQRAAVIYDQVQLDATFVVANDPFFGRGGLLLARTQRDAKMKYEAVVPIAGISGQAVSSFNYHRDQMGNIFGLTCVDGSVAHTACVGFGLERIVISLFDQHGCDVREWPVSVRRALNLEDICV
jgi:seryl-tRNA synthetase